MLDNHSVAYLLLPPLIAALLAQLLNWRINRDVPGLGFWSAGLALQTLGVALRAHMNDIPNGIGIPFINALLVGGQFVLLLGLCRFAGRPMYPKTAMVTLALLVVGVGIFTSVSDNILIRTLIFTAAMAVAIGLQISLLPGIARRLGGASVVALATACGLTMTILILRSLALIVFGPGVIGSMHVGEDLSFLGRQSLTTIIATILGMAYCYGYVLLVTSRSRWQLQQTAIIDALTGIPNRRAFEAELAHGASRAKRTGTRLGLALLDLDRFKQVNDSSGHEAGDALLRHFSQVARGALREIDFFARVGGEEFALLIDDATIDTLHHAAERIRFALEASPLMLLGGEVRATVSVGVAVSALGAADVDGLFAAADAALYRAKALGRNQVERASPSADAPTRAVEGAGQGL